MCQIGQGQLSSLKAGPWDNGMLDKSLTAARVCPLYYKCGLLQVVASWTQLPRQLPKLHSAGRRTLCINMKLCRADEPTDDVLTKPPSFSIISCVIPLRQKAKEEAKRQTVPSISIPAPDKGPTTSEFCSQSLAHLRWRWRSTCTHMPIVPGNLERIRCLSLFGQSV